MTRPLLGVLAAAFALVAAAAQDGATPKKQKPNTFEEDGIRFTAGPAKVKLGRYAEIDLPEGFASVNRESLKKFYDRTHNPFSGNEIGVVLSRDGWTIYFDYMDSGHINDSDKSDLDANALYKKMVEGQKAGNAERRKNGWSELMMKGWRIKPHYDEETKNLTWAFRLASSGDNYTKTIINQNIRLLGRTGYVSAIVVGDDNDGYAKTEAAANELLKNFRFVSGQTYAEFRSGDKVAQYGLAALVLGGATAVAAKTGFLAKFWKVIVLGVAAIGAWFAKMFKKLFGGGAARERFGDNPDPKP